MTNQLIRNRAELSKLIYHLGAFSESELIDQFRVIREGEIAIDGAQTIADYLRELAYIGVLSYEYGKYYVEGYRH